MDDRSNREYSRTPEIGDLVSICRSLNEQGARYILIGGFAVILHGSVRGTKDIDLLIDPSEKNITLIKKALSFLPDNAIAMIEDDEIKRYEVVRIADEVVVDLMAKACGIDYSEASQGIDWMEIEGIKIPVAKKEWLIRMKNTIRPSDQSDILYLQHLITSDREGKNH